MFLVAGIFSVKAQNAQEVENQQQNVTKRHIIKTNVLGYALKNINVSYEYALTSYLSLSVSSGYVPTGKIAFIDLIEDKLKSESSNKDLSNLMKTNVGMTTLTFEPRFYLGKGYGKGFYLAPYYRYTNVYFDNLKFQNKDVYTMNLNFKGRAHAHSGGILVGTQWFLGKEKNWVIDTFIGGHYGLSYGSTNSPIDIEGLNGTLKKTIIQQQKESIKNKVEHRELPGVKEIKADIENDTVYTDIKGFWAGVRVGFSIGYRF